MPGVFSDNKAEHRFEYAMNDAVAFAVYRRTGTSLYIDHVEAPPVLRGTGAAGLLMQGIVDVAAAEKRSLVPVCPYAVSWLAKHDPSPAAKPGGIKP